MHIWESAGALTDLAKCAKPAPGNLSGATHTAVSETELSLRAVHHFHTYCAPVGTTMFFSVLMHFSSFRVSVDIFLQH